MVSNVKSTVDLLMYIIHLFESDKEIRRKGEGRRSGGGAVQKRRRSGRAAEEERKRSGGGTDAINRQNFSNFYFFFCV